MSATKRRPVKGAVSLETIARTQVLLLAMPIEGEMVVVSTDRETMTIWQRERLNLYGQVHQLPYVETTDARHLSLGEVHDKAATALRMFHAGRL